MKTIQQWYLGGGAHIKLGTPGTRVYYGYNNDSRVSYVYRQNAFATSLDGNIGVEYKFKAIPLALSTNLKPFTEINDFENIYMAIDPGISVKFTN